MASEDSQTVPQPPVLPMIGPGKRTAPEAAGVAGTTETIEAAETTETDVTKEPERGRGGIRAPPVAVEGSFLRELKETALYGAVQDESCALMTGLERLRFQYFTHFCLSLGTAVPEFPSVRPLLFTRFRLTRVDEDADVVIATGSLSAAPFACHLNGRRRVLLGLEGAQGNLREKQALRLEAKEAREAEERGDKEETWVTGELLALRVVNVG